MKREGQNQTIKLCQLAIGLLLMVSVITSAFAQGPPETQSQWRERREKTERAARVGSRMKVWGLVGAAAGSAVSVWGLTNHATRIESFSCTRSGGVGPNGEIPCRDIPPHPVRYAKPNNLALLAGLGGAVGGITLWAEGKGRARRAALQLRDLDEMGRSRGWVRITPQVTPSRVAAELQFRW